MFISKRLATTAVTFACTAALLLGSASRAQDSSTTKPVEPVDYKKLKELLPDNVGGLKRSKSEGGKQAFGEMKMSQAKGEYSEKDKDANANITIIDYGAVPGMAAGVSPWMNVEIDNDSDTEYSRTVKIGDYKGMESYNKENKSGSLLLMVAGRFMVSIEINDLPSETLKATGEALKLADLAALAK